MKLGDDLIISHFKALKDRHTGKVGGPLVHCTYSPEC